MLQSNFIRDIVAEDLRTGRHKHVRFRFPPEPNGFLHLGHSKSICLNFGLAKEFGAPCHLRFDDTNPAVENEDFVKAIKRDIKWLGFDWGEHLYYASDHFEKLYTYAVELIKKGLAFVDSESLDQIRARRGSISQAGTNSPYRERRVDENLDLFTKMRNRQFDTGACVLRAKIDMASNNMNMRDPILYRVLHDPKHHRQKDNWCIYPMYDFAHGLCDAIEGITHSLCTLEFEDHRPLYDWFLEKLSVPCRPRQIEFARAQVEGMPMSKRVLSGFVSKKHVTSWSDPRMPTLAGLRRRGYTPQAIAKFWQRVGVTKKNATLKKAQLEWALKEELDPVAPRAMGVLRPLKVIIDNWPENHVESLKAPVHPKNPALGARPLELRGEIFIEHTDFMLEPSKNFFRLAPHRRVRLRYACIIECVKVVTDAKGAVTALHANYEPQSWRGAQTAGKPKVRSIIHWADPDNFCPCTVHMYDDLLTEDGAFNPQSQTSFNALCERAALAQEQHVQFERHGFFIKDPEASPTFHQSVALKLPPI